MLATLLVPAAHVKAIIWYLGVGNDGYVGDVQGLYDTLKVSKNWKPPNPLA
jgi:hypothetical protein